MLEKFTFNSNIPPETVENENGSLVESGQEKELSETQETEDILLNQDGVWQDSEGAAWISVQGMATELGLDVEVVYRFANELPSRLARTLRRSVSIYPHEELAAKLENYLGDAVVDDATGEYLDEEGEVWISLVGYADAKLSGDNNKVYKAKKSLETKYLKTKNSRAVVEVAKMAELDAAFADFLALPDLENGRLVDEGGKAWVTVDAVSTATGLDKPTIRVRAARVNSKRAKEKATVSTVYEEEDLLRRLDGLDTLPVVDESGTYTDEKGGQWAAARNLLAVHGISAGFLQNHKQIITTIPGRGGQGKKTDLYNVARAVEEYTKWKDVPLVDENSRITEEDGTVWIPFSRFAKDGNINLKSASKKVKDAQLPTREARPENGGNLTMYRLTDLQGLFQDELEVPVLEQGTTEWVDSGGIIWTSVDSYAETYGVTESTLVRKLKNDDSPSLSVRIQGQVGEIFYQKADLERLVSLYKDVPFSDPETGIYTNGAGQEFGGIGIIADLYDVDKATAAKKVKDLTPISVRGKTKKVSDYYLLSDVASVFEERLALPQIGEDGHYTDGQDLVWLSVAAASARFGVVDTSIKLRSDRHSLEKIFGLNHNKQKVVLYREDELVGLYENPTQELRREEQRLTTELHKYLETEVVTNDDITSLISLLGKSAMGDILLTLRPDFKTIPTREFENILSQFLGDFEVANRDYRPTLVELARSSAIENILSEEKVVTRVREVMKAKCLVDFSNERGAIEHDEEDILMEIIAGSLHDQIAAVVDPSPKLLEVAAEVQEYFRSLASYFELKPGYVRGQLREGRPFPDLFQRINIKEIEDKKRVLIADEMGVGKSGSVILAKEILGIGSTLILSPANVVDTWKKYLSTAEDGYFTEGDNLPSVLIVESPNDLARSDLATFDYVILSQERLNDEYMELLDAYNPAMLVVDEVHKLKNTQSGSRSRNLQSLADRVEKTNGHLALLSGTPAPNKVRDVALLLKLLHPEDPRYKSKSAQEIEYDILHGDLLSVRADLTERMQRKKLRDIQDMPELYAGEDQILNVALDENERAAYEAILEDDEMTPTLKMQALRTFLLNPQLDGALGEDYVPSKVRMLNSRLTEVLEEKGKIVVYVNGYIEGVVRNGNSILGQLDLPEDVRVEVIDGTTSRAERRRIEQDLKTDSRIVVFVSGQTADVGVDFSGADHGIMYNEPWTMADRSQQISRIYRPPHEGDLTVDTLITGQSIEEGIFAYIRLKQELIERLLDGGALSSEERTFLARADQQPERNLEENPELAREYLKNSDELMRMFGSLRGQGEKKVRSFIEGYGFEYAHYYSQSSARSYEANANRVVGSLLKHVSDSAGEDSRVIDIGGGPEMLRQHSPEDVQDSVVTIDINPDQLASGPSNKKAVGSMTRLPLASNIADAATFNFSLHYTHHKSGKGDYERYDALSEGLRVLKTGGRLFVNHTYADSFQYPELLPQLAEVLGAKIDEQLSGELVGDHYRSNLYVFQKIGSPTGGEFDSHALKIKHNKGSRLTDSRRVITDAHLKTKSGEFLVPLELNSEDEAVRNEEREILGAAKVLVEKHGSTELIPVDELKDQGFCRYKANKKYNLFKKLESGKGYVVCR